MDSDNQRKQIASTQPAASYVASVILIVGLLPETFTQLLALVMVALLQIVAAAAVDKK